VAHPNQSSNDAATVAALLRALRQAEKYAAAHPDETKQILAKYTKLDPAIIDGIWHDFSFKLALTQQLMADWNAEAQWARTTGMVTPQTAIPDFAQSIDSQFLSTIDPEAVKLK
jgi:ABC-type nitrate/sulfonate/bicarbonate transport system substrate-binding protein